MKWCFGDHNRNKIFWGVMIALQIIIFSLVLTLCYTFSWDRAGCEVSLNDELYTYLPLLLNPDGGEGHDAYILPENKGKISFTSKEVMNVNCPGGVVTLLGEKTTVSSLNAACSSGKNFKISGKTVPFSNITCSKFPAHVARYTEKPCLDKYREVEVGFDLEDGRFLRHMIICFDNVLQTTVYSQFDMTHAVNGFQVNYPRPEFIEGKGFYSIGKHKLNNLYTRYVQRVTINKLLGLGIEDYTYIHQTNDFYLARGHLTAKADFVYGSQQRFTFYYVNAAPQWQTFNAGNWNTFEQNCRDFASKSQLDLVVYTGTHGVSTLPHASTGKETELFIYVDGKNKGLPVPKMFWKVLYDPVTQAGTAFIGLNNPYREDISEDIVCKDVCDQIAWLSISKDIKAGYMYCCTVAEFRKTVTTLPKFTVKKLLK